MCGDAILVCDVDTGLFFAGWNKQTKPFSEETPTPIWCETVDEARKNRSLGSMHNVVKIVGGGARVISESKARQIEALNKCRARQNVGGA